MKIVLASGSPRRSSLLKQLGFSFTVDPSDEDEIVEPGQSPEQIATGLAYKKGASVAVRHPDSLLIAADTIVVLDDEIIGKPSGTEDAKIMLQQLSGKSHMVYTGIVLLKTSSECKIAAEATFCEKTIVSFSKLSRFEIEHYVEKSNPLDKAGSYGIQDDLGCLFVEKIEGDYYNVVGFPVNRFYHQLKSFEPDLAASVFSRQH